MKNKGYKIFVSYKYKDTEVYPLKNSIAERYYPTTVRDYVDILESFFDKQTNNIYKGESDDCDLSSLDDNTIWNLLKDRIFDSSITIILISPNMKEKNCSEKSQWIPWEISFSLKEITRNDRTSHSNALLAIVLPDRRNDYSYFMYDINCPGTTCRCLRYNTDVIFSIIERNMFNKSNPEKTFCDNNSSILLGDHSYISFVRWNEFCSNPQRYIENAVRRKNNIDEYNISKEV